MAEQGNSDNLSYSQLNATDDFHELCCTRCAKKRKNKPSVKYCTVCGEYFCQKCLEKHDSYQAMKVHPMVDTRKVGQSTRTAVNKLLAVPTEFCPHHPMKLVDMYCETDNVVGCSVCFNLEHK
ncbi:B-Box C-terminal domain [Mactra antiquata]